MKLKAILSIIVIIAAVLGLYWFLNFQDNQGNTELSTSKRTEARTALGGVYSFDGENVYSEGMHDDEVSLIPEADISTFKVLPGGQYAKDSSHVYWYGTIIKGADSNSFVSLAPYYYAKDARYAYRMNSRLEEFDPNTFVALNSVYIKDAHVVYLATVDEYRLIPEADPTTFVALKGPGNTFPAQDKNHSYKLGKVVE